MLDHRLWRWTNIKPSMGQRVMSPWGLRPCGSGLFPGRGGLKETKLFLPHPLVKLSIAGKLRDRDVACSVSDRQGLNFESCDWWEVSSHSSHHSQEVLLAQFSLYLHKSCLKPDSVHFICHVSLNGQPANNEIHRSNTRWTLNIVYHNTQPFTSPINYLSSLIASLYGCDIE